MDHEEPRAKQSAALGGRGGGNGRRDGGGAEDGKYSSYYGRPVLKPPVWEWKIPAYLFAGGLSAGSAVLAAGADLTGRPGLRRVGRLSALLNLLVSLYWLIADLGRPQRFHHMLRVAKPTSPMSIGTWVLSAYGPGVGAAAVAELLPRRWRGSPLGTLAWRLARPANLCSALVAPAVASYTAVLLSQTAAPAWHEVHAELPFVFTGSAAASAGGLCMALAPVEEAGPARTFAAYGAVGELAAAELMHRRLHPVVRESYATGKAGKLRLASEGLTAAGLVGTAFARRSRAVSVASGLAMLAGSALQRFAVFTAGVESTKDPKYVTVPQRQRLAERRDGVDHAGKVSGPAAAPDRVRHPRLNLADDWPAGSS